MTAKEYNLAVENYSDNIFRFALKHLRNEMSAKDIVQETFTKVWIKHEEVSSEKVKSYLFTTAYHAIVDWVKSERRSGAALGAFNIQVEAYPDLKASTNFMQFQTEIADIENKLAAVRRYFNSATKELNTAVESIPSNIVAGIKKYTVQPMFDLGTDQRVEMDKAPEIKF